MWKVTTLLTRPSVDTPWYTPSEVTLNKLQENKDSGKLLYDKLDRRLDGLARNYTMIWATKEDWEAYVSDPVLDVERQKRRLWNSRRGIQVEIIDAREVDQI